MLKEEIAPCSRPKRRDFYSINIKIPVCMVFHICKRYNEKIVKTHPYFNALFKQYLHYKSNITSFSSAWRDTAF